jgi:hypothetical protein
MGIPNELPIIQRLVVLGLALVRLLELNPTKKGRGRPKGVIKPLDERATADQRKALDWYEAKLSELPQIPGEKILALGNGIERVISLIPDAEPLPKNSTRFLASLVKLAGGNAAVASALNEPLSNVEEWQQTERAVASAQLMRKKLWKETVRSVPQTGSPDRTTIAKAMRRLRRARSITRIAAALMGTEK